MRLAACEHASKEQSVRIAFFLKISRKPVTPHKSAYRQRSVTDENGVYRYLSASVGSRPRTRRIAAVTNPFRGGPCMLVLCKERPVVNAIMISARSFGSDGG